MPVLSRKKRIGPPLTAEEEQQRLQLEIGNLRTSMGNLSDGMGSRFALTIELRERRLASLRRHAAGVAHSIANCGGDAR